MPEISRFYGIVIKIYFINTEHNPPHFHAIYGENVGEYDIRTLELLDGYLPFKASRLVIEWATKHKEELMSIWRSQEFKNIRPLE